MVVSQVASHFASDIGGPFEVMVNVDRELRKMHDLIDYKLLVFGEMLRDDERFGTLHIGTFLSNRYGFTWRFISRGMRLQLRRSDVVIVHGFYLFSTLLAVVFARRGSKIFIAPHGSFDSFHRSKSKLAKHIFNKTFMLLSDRIHCSFIVASRRERLEVLSQWSEHPVFEVGLGIDSPDSSTVRFDRLELNSIRLLSLSRIHPVKNLEAVILAMPEILKIFPKLVLQIAGDGDQDYINELKVLVARLSLGNSIEFLGFVEGSRKADLLKESNIYILLSHSESFAIAAAEAIAIGIPVVLSNQVGIADFVAERSVGIVLTELDADSVAGAISKVVREYSNYSQRCLLNSHLLYWPNVFQRWSSTLGLEPASRDAHIC